jgi:5-methyltetrahydrofolate--homocysteine methyltransferase
MSELERKLAGSGLVITGELPIVDGGGLDAVRAKLEQYAPWVDAVNATDNTAAHAHASNLAVAIALKMLGVEPIMQVVCRDKNRLAIQADIVGAALHGIENISCLTGDDVTAGDEQEARRVFDLDGPQVIVTAAALARGEYLSGRKLEPAPHLFIGAVENPGAPPLAYRAQRALKKARAGARFLQLQICYEPAQLEAFCAEGARIGLFDHTSLLPSICLVAGARPLEFMDADVPGISVPAATIERVKNADAKKPSSWPSNRLATPSHSRACAACISSRSARTTRSGACASASASPQPRSETRVDTVLQSRSRTVTIAIDKPFCIIGERINPTGRKAFAQELREGNLERVIEDADAQIAMGADMLDVNAGIPLVDEAELLAQMIRLLQDHTDIPLCIDSSVIEALEAGLDAYEGKALVNSVTGEDDRLELILPIVAKHGAAVIGLTNDETGIPETAEKRLEIARKIVSVAGDHGIPPEDVVLDPLAMTVGADPQAVRITLDAIEMIRDELGVNMCLGASNVSFGLPERHTLNAAFLAMGSAHGLTSAIMNALSEECVRSVRASDLMLGKDEWGANWISAHRARQAAVPS